MAVPMTEPMTELTAAPFAILDQAALTQALSELGARDPIVAKALEHLGPPPLRRWEPGFGTLVDTIVGQQVSVASARAIQGRLVALVQPFTPDRLLAIDPETLRGAGLSRQKLGYVRDIAAALTDGRVDLARIGGEADEDAIGELIRIKGIGRWTAEIYLMFALGRPDIWPSEDLGLQAGWQHLYRLAERPSGKALRGLGTVWQPWRSAGALLLWHVYHHRVRWQEISAPSGGEPA
jgi:DNA-3-methyladenine glycosylase II